MKPERKGTMSYEDRRRFAVGVLKGIAAPVTAGNVETLLAWMSRENTAARNNPMATTFSSDGWKAHNYRTKADGSKVAHVKHYPSFEEGVRSTVLTLLGYSKGNLLSDRQVAEKLGAEPRYPVVLDLLRRGTDPQEIIDNSEAAEEVEKWGTFEKRIGYGAEDTWGYTREELESLAPGELEASYSETLRPINGYDFPDPTTSFAVEFESDTVEESEGADVEQFADIQEGRPEVEAPFTTESAEDSFEEGDEVTESDNTVNPATVNPADGLQGTGVDQAPNQQLVDPSVPIPRSRSSIGRGQTGEEAVLFQDVIDNATQQLQLKFVEILGISVPNAFPNVPPGVMKRINDQIFNKIMTQDTAVMDRITTTSDLRDLYRQYELLFSVSQGLPSGEDYFSWLSNDMNEQGFDEKNQLEVFQSTVKTLIENIKAASEFLGTDELVNQLDNLLEPGTFDRQQDRASNEFIHALAVDEHLSVLDAVGPMGPPNASINVTPSEDPLGDPLLEDPSVIPEEDDDLLEGLDELDDETAALIRNNLGAVSFFEQRTPDFMYDSDGDGEGDTNIIEWLIANPNKTDVQILEALRSVPWFQSTGPFSRQFQMDYFAEGPAGKDELIADQRDAILKEAKLIGFNWIEDDPELLNNLAYEASLYGWSDADRKRALSGLNTYQASEFKRGKILANRQTVLDTAAKYYVPIGESAANDLAFNIYKGDETTASLEAMYREQAKGMFPTLSGLIDQGITPKTYFSPYQEKISQLLEVSDVDLMNDPRFQAIMFPEAGKGPLSLYETQRYVRQLPEWQYTKNADESARRMVNNIGKIMGVVA
jgi:hypothetical protein